MRILIVYVIAAVIFVGSDFTRGPRSVRTFGLYWLLRDVWPAERIVTQERIIERIIVQPPEIRERIIERVIRETVTSPSPPQSSGLPPCFGGYGGMMVTAVVITAPCRPVGSFSSMTVGP